MLKSVLNRLRSWLARRADARRGPPAGADRRRRPETARDDSGGPRARILFSREQREAARRAEGGTVGRRGTHGGKPADAGWHKDREARPHD
jgi:hypothetical protein